MCLCPSKDARVVVDVQVLLIKLLQVKLILVSTELTPLNYSRWIRTSASNISVLANNEKLAIKTTVQAVANILIATVITSIY